jgi:thiol-disulfide isomerase/thioredoxin
MFSPLYDSWAQEFAGKAKFLKVNPDSGREIFEKYQIQVIPTLLILDGKRNIIRRSNGFKEISDIDKRLEKIKGKKELFPQDFK